MFPALELTLLLLSAAVLAVVAFRMLHLPPMLGYLTVGIIIGPFGMSLAGDSESTHTLAEFGVVFLMFSIGLEFSLPKLSAMRKSVFGLGLAQVVANISLTMLVANAASFWFPSHVQIPWTAAFALGGAMAMSSTAIVSKLLTDRLEMDSEHGKRIMGVLLFQDLALVPLLIVVPALSKPATELVATLTWAGIKAAVVLFVLLFVGQKVLRGWFNMVVRRRSQELFMLNLLLVTLGAAWLTQKAGLSMDLGAFIAGMLVSETEYKHQVEEDIKPFRDVLLGLFFITVGMMLNVGLVVRYWWVVMLLLLVPVFLKFGMVASLARLFGSRTGVALRTGLALAQAGEFGFVLMNQVSGLHMVDDLVVQLLLASMVLSMLLAPFLIAKSDAIVMKLSANEWMMQSLAITKIATRTMAVQKHVIIAGFGRSGQNLAGLLSAEGISYHALDLDPDRVREAQAAGANVSFGNAVRRESLLAAGIHRASALVITYADTSAALKTLHFAHELMPNLPVIVRSHDDSDMDKLRAAGAEEVVPEAIEGSLMLASHALLRMGVPLRKVVHRVQDARSDRYASLRGYFHGRGDGAGEMGAVQTRLHAVELTERASAVNKKLEQLELDQHGVEVTAVRRNGVNVELLPELLLQVGDVLVLRGSVEGVALAEMDVLR